MLLIAFYVIPDYDEVQADYLQIDDGQVASSDELITKDYMVMKKVLLKKRKPRATAKKAVEKFDELTETDNFLR